MDIVFHCADLVTFYHSCKFTSGDVSKAINHQSYLLPSVWLSFHIVRKFCKRGTSRRRSARLRKWLNNHGFFLFCVRSIKLSSFRESKGHYRLRTAQRKVGYYQTDNFDRVVLDIATVVTVDFSIGEVTSFINLVNRVTFRSSFKMKVILFSLYPLASSRRLQNVYRLHISESDQEMIRR